MPTRKEFLKTTGMAALGVSAIGAGFPGFKFKSDFTSKRPAPGKRNFSSRAVDETIREVKKAIPGPELSWLFENCFPNTLDTTVEFQLMDGKPDTFVITGDIPAMWLRDSSAQVWPYLPLATKDDHLRTMLAGVINRQTKCINIDPYANAFNKKPTGSEWDSDLTDMNPWLHERKWEVDSLCYPIRLAHGYWKTTGDTSPFDPDWQKAMETVVKTFKEQQRKDGHGPYKFQRETAVKTDTVAGSGYGNPIQPTGMICSTFRPSDDSTIYLFLIPSNHFAVVSLRNLAEMQEKIKSNTSFARECRDLANEVEEAIQEYAVMDHLNFGKIYPYEVDGFGNRLFMDDANVPSLLSLPYLDACDPEDPIYHRTRNFVLSQKNPYFFKGSAAEGIGGPHVGMDMIWPMSIIMRGLTSDDDQEISYCLKILKNTHGGTGFMHESFNKNNPKNFTRKWFAWANTLFGEFVLKTYHEKPHLLNI